MKLSQFGRLMADQAPIVDLMEDLGQALNVNPDILFLGGGNPALVPEAQACFKRHLQNLLDSPEQLQTALGVYQSPQGNESTLMALADYLRRSCSWPVTERNIALVGGSQTAFFILLNLFAGLTPEGRRQQVVLPLVPEYLGYGSQGLMEHQFVATRPLITETAPHRFKYRVDLDRLTLHDSAGLLCVSLPTNPSGNLLTQDELSALGELARARGVPVLVDCAYGMPFPGVVYGKRRAHGWDPNMVNVMSLSKLGLPGLRTGVVVASEEIIRLVTRANTIVSLASGNLGPDLLGRLLSSGDLDRLTDTVLPAFYRRQRDILLALLEEHLQGLPYRVHEPEGAFFLWLWLENLPVSSQELYQRLKARGVLVMAGEPFFFGLERDWRHGRECLRLTYCQSPEVLAQAVALLAQELRDLYP